MDFNNYDVNNWKKKTKRSKLSLVMIIISVLMMIVFVGMVFFYISLKESIKEDTSNEESRKIEGISEIDELKEFHYATITGSIEYTEVGSGLTLGNYLDDFVKREKNPNVTIWGKFSKSWIYLCVSGITDDEESVQTARIIIDSTGTYIAVNPLGVDKFIDEYRLSSADQKKWNYMQTVGYIRVADGKTGEQVVDEVKTLFKDSVNADGGHIAYTTAGTPAFVFDKGFYKDTDLGSFFKNINTEIKAAVETTGEVGDRTFSMRVSGEVSLVLEINESMEFYQKPTINYVDKVKYDELLEARLPADPPSTEDLSKYGEDEGVAD